MSRGEIWTLAGGGDYTGKPRPAVILQDDRYDATSSITVCPFTTNEADAFLFRPLIEPSPDNGLVARSRLMADRVSTVRRARLGIRIGELNDQDVAKLNEAVLLFLGLARPTETSAER